jgi:hypothetical protein
MEWRKLIGRCGRLRVGIAGRANGRAAYMYSTLQLSGQSGRTVCDFEGEQGCVVNELCNIALIFTGVNSWVPVSLQDARLVFRFIQISPPSIHFMEYNFSQPNRAEMCCLTEAVQV